MYKRQAKNTPIPFFSPLPRLFVEPDFSNDKAAFCLVIGKIGKRKAA